MLHTIIRKNSYQDSITLMLLTNMIATMDGVAKVSIMMGTPANKDILAAGGLGTPELAGAGANDIAMVMDIDSENRVEGLLAAVDEFLRRQGEGNGQYRGGDKPVRDWAQAWSARPDSNIVLLSIPGAYVESEADRILEEGRHVFIFSDNVPLEVENRLKKKAADKGLLVMGPDCGTALIRGVPFAFTNVIPRGRIGLVGASGTGIQEISTQIARRGAGVSQAIGTGGRDINGEINASTMKTALAVLADDPDTDCLVVVAKPPASLVREEIMSLLRAIEKPCVAVFIGERPAAHEEGLFLADTLEEAAELAVALATGEDPSGRAYRPELPPSPPDVAGRTIRGLYAGGTLAGEAAALLTRALGLTDNGAGHHEEGFMFRHGGHEIIDLGDDAYTRGKPHPMIDPQTRTQHILNAAGDARTGLILLDFVEGYGAHTDMAGALVPAIREAGQIAGRDGRSLLFMACVCGTENDPQPRSEQVRILEEAGVYVAPSNAAMVAAALGALGLDLAFPAKEIGAPGGPKASALPPVPESVRRLFADGPVVVNAGVRGFTRPFEDLGIPYVQLDWRPVAGGDVELQGMLNFLNRHDNGSIDLANQEVIDKILTSSPFLLDVRPARELIPALAEKKVLLHAGPPICWKNMTRPMRGSCVGAALFEGWAGDEDEARNLLETGGVEFLPCHSVNAVGPMGGITSANMPLLVVLNKTDGNFAYCTMNEGIGAVLRFGAYNEAVIERLRWMRDVLGPTLSKVLGGIEGGLNINVLATKAIAMGDEFHQRNIAGSLNFLKEIAPLLVAADVPEEHRRQVMRFLADTDQFFLNIMMAAAKSVMDAARTLTQGSVVTAMTRNGENFGIRISGMGDEWFTAPVNTPDGLYFTGYSSADANPDMGDSAITETFGVGGMAMIAAPAVTRFVGSGGFDDALATSNEMMEICLGRNPNFPVPTWNFQGICLGIDARRVVATGITPVINTGIAHKQAGIGQIGAGTVHPPLACFEKAVRAYARKLGYGRA
ncbi:MAG: acyl-CoA synthetase FdrA [Desulfovibrio sp.]|jgi:succinyl-CoA synthetase alpha subunit|nr:acyl-CoA synthetase FdrA [Desulfovibrio sp.]